MCVIATDILTDLCGLSLGLILLLVPVGLLLWLLGWWSHRFWIVLTTTVAAGLVGLLEATGWKAQPIVVAMLLAIAAGVLALALVRVITFAAGGFAGLYLVQLFLPTLNQPVICFLVSGMVSLLLFRWFFMALTSFLGSAFLVYGVLALLNYRELLDAAHWTEANAMILNITCGVMTLFGLGFQFLFDRYRIRRKKERQEQGGDDLLGAVIGAIGGKKKSKKRAA
jgi:hypothetical protein